MAQITPHTASPSSTHFSFHIWWLCLTHLCLLIAFCMWITSGSPSSSVQHELSIQTDISYSTLCSTWQDTISKKYPPCSSVIQRDWWVNTTQTKSMAYDCNISFGSNPKGKGSAVCASAAQFDSSWGRCSLIRGT